MFGGGIVRSGFRWCVSPPNWVWRSISYCPRTFFPANRVLAGYLALPLDISPRQKGFGGESLRINSIPIQKKAESKPENTVLVLIQPLFLLHSTADSSDLTDLILRVTFVIPIILKDYRFLFRCRPAHHQFCFHSMHS